MGNEITSLFTYIGSPFWFVLFLVLMAIEAPTMALTTIWFAGGALAAFLFALIGVPVAIQFAVFFIVSIILLGITRPLAIKYLNKKREPTNADRFIGETGIVTMDISNLKGTGEVQVRGVPWMARAEPGQKNGDLIKEGELVKIVAIEGVKLIVKRDDALESDVPNNEKAEEEILC